MVGVLFTGGLDSTYLLYKNLKEGKEVTPFYIEITTNVEKTKMERRSCQKIWDLLRNEFGYKLNYMKDIVTIGISYQCTGSSALPQMPLWIFGCWQLQGYYRKELTELQIGYVMNDDAISYLEEMKKVYYSYECLVDEHYEGGMIPLNFPLIKYNKKQIMDLIPENIAAEVMSCESVIEIGDDHYSCGECNPCTKYKQMETPYYNSYLAQKFTQLYSYKQLLGGHEINNRARELRARLFPEDGLDYDCIKGSEGLG